MGKNNPAVLWKLLNRKAKLSTAEVKCSDGQTTFLSCLVSTHHLTSKLKKTPRKQTNKPLKCMTFPSDGKLLLQVWYFHADRWSWQQECLSLQVAAHLKQRDVHISCSTVLYIQNTQNFFLKSSHN